MPGAGADKPEIEETIALDDPWVFPIPGAQEFNWFGQLTNQANNNTSTFASPLGRTLVVPKFYAARISGLTFQVDDAVNWAPGILTYRLLLDGAAVSGYDQIVVFPQVANVVTLSLDVKTRIEGSHERAITVTATNTTGGVRTIQGVVVSGWWWPMAGTDNWLRTGL